MADIPVTGLFKLDNMKSPDNTDVLLAFHLDASGKPIETESGYYTVATLIAALGKVATDAEQGAITAQQAAEAAQAICEEALATIGNSDSTGLRGQAVEAINAARTAALAAIGETDSAGARGEALTAIATALQNALASIGQTDDEGARKSALDAIQAALTAALASIGNNDNEGARKAALDAISTARTNALTAIGESDTTGARGNAIASINQLYATIEAAITQANTTIDQKVSAASDSAALAEKWATNPEDTLVDGSEYSSKHYAKKSEYWANQAQAAVNIPDIYGYSETIGDGSTLEFTIIHNMNTTTIIHDVWANTDDGVGFYSISTINANSLKITFEEAPAAGAITVNLLPVRLKNAN